MGTDFRFYNYNKEIKLKYLDQQILVYKDLINKLEMSKQVIKDFDNKPCNVKIGRKLEDLKTSSFTETTRRDDGMYNGIIFNSGIIGYHTTLNGYIKNNVNNNIHYIDSIWCNININLLDGTKKIDASKTNIAVDEKIIELNDYITKCENSKELIDDMLLDYKKIKKAIEEWEEKYPYCIQDSLYFRCE